MNKILKYILLIISIVILIILLVLGIGILVSYQNYKWMNNAKDMGGIIFGSDVFNKQLEICSPSYSDSASYYSEPWKIRGLEKDKCVVIFNKLSSDTETIINEHRIKYNIYYCELPNSIYFDPSKINWTNLLNSEYCTVS